MTWVSLVDGPIGLAAVPAVSGIAARFLSSTLLPLYRLSHRLIASSPTQSPPPPPPPANAAALTTATSLPSHTYPSLQAVWRKRHLSAALLDS